VTVAPQRRRKRTALAAAAAALVLAVVVGACEWAGWPFLAQPAQRALADLLKRPVDFGGAAAQMRIHLLGHLRVDAPFIQIGAPEWSRAGPLLVARDAQLVVDWTALWRAWQGAPLRIRSLTAAQADIRLERLADGRASWQFGSPDPAGEPATLPQFDRLEVGSGTVQYVDAPLQADIQARFALVDGNDDRASAGTAPASGAASMSAASASASASASAPAARRLQVDAQGRWRGFPAQARLQSNRVLPWVAQGADAVAVPLRIDAMLGRAKFAFQGTVTDALQLARLQGRYSLSGPSLAAVGDPLGVTLPTTPAFNTEGLLARDGAVWRVVVDKATVGSSRLNGAFSYDQSGKRPMLAGRLNGSRLMLADLGPAVGGRDRSAKPEQTAAPATAARPGGRLLPDRPFDLPALRAMNANVLIDIADVDLNTDWLEPLKPLSAHLLLQGGVLNLTDLQARTAQGRLAGTVTLDGREPRAQWAADLRWNDVRLERFIRQTRADKAPPWVAGRLRGEAKLAGQGRSTAEILGSLRGNVRTQLRDGSVSHLAVEAAGIDVAQGLGMLVKGDDALPVQCAVADLAVAGGKFTPRVMVIDTKDSTILVDGSLSLATEQLDLRAIVSPKDFSPLTLRTPVRVRGSFAAPEVSLEKGPLGRTIGAAALLALVNPLAAIIPFIDVARPDEAQQDAAGCKSLVRRGVAAKAQPPGSVKK